MKPTYIILYRAVLTYLPV